MDVLFLRPLNVKQHAVQLEYTFFQCTCLIGNLTRLRGWVSSRFALNHDVKVDEFLGEGGHVVLEAELVFADMVRREHVVALPLALANEHDLAVRVLDLEVDVERPSGLHLCNVGCH